MHTRGETTNLSLLPNPASTAQWYRPQRRPSSGHFSDCQPAAWWRAIVAGLPSGREMSQSLWSLCGMCLWQAWGGISVAVETGGADAHRARREVDRQVTSAKSRCVSRLPYSPPPTARKLNVPQQTCQTVVSTGSTASTMAWLAAPERICNSGIAPSQARWPRSSRRRPTDTTVSWSSAVHSRACGLRAAADAHTRGTLAWNRLRRRLNAVCAVPEWRAARRGFPASSPTIAQTEPRYTA